MFFLKDRNSKKKEHLKCLNEKKTENHMDIKQTKATGTYSEMAFGWYSEIPQIDSRHKSSFVKRTARHFSLSSFSYEIA